MTSLAIPGVNGDKPLPFEVDTTSEYIGNLFTQYIDVFAEVYNKPLGTPATSTTAAVPAAALTDTDYQDLQEAYQQLVLLAQGIQLPGESNVQRLNFQMAVSLDTLFKTLSVNGLDTLFQGAGASLTPAQQVAALQQWWNLAPAGLGNSIQSALTAGQSWQSIQAMIELDFVKQGNDLISSQLSGLQTQLNNTQTAVQLLTQLQNLYNEVTPANPGTFATPSGTGDTFVRNYISEGTNGSGSFTGFNNPIQVQSTATTTDQTTFTGLQQQIQSLITSTLAAAGYTATDPQYQGSLAQQLQTVLNDTNQATNLNSYIVDSQGATTQSGVQASGQYGRDLANAEVAAQSINTQQQQQVNQALYVFEEFYQSAAGMLTSITQIIQNMAQAAGQ